MLLKLAGIGKLFGARAVLRNISFEVHPGTVTLLVGANGAGKTTLLKIMAGLARSTITEKADGTVIYADRCSISEDKLAKMGVTFKKIPRDISRL